MDKSLALKTIKVQILASAVLFQRPLASHSLVRVFVQGVAHMFSVDSVLNLVFFCVFKDHLLNLSETFLFISFLIKLPFS